MIALLFLQNMKNQYLFFLLICLVIVGVGCNHHTDTGTQDAFNQFLRERKTDDSPPARGFSYRSVTTDVNGIVSAGDGEWSREHWIHKTMFYKNMVDARSLVESGKVANRSAMVSFLDAFDPADSNTDIAVYANNRYRFTLRNKEGQLLLSHFDSVKDPSKMRQGFNKFASPFGITDIGFVFAELSSSPHRFLEFGKAEIENVPEAIRKENLWELVIERVASPGVNSKYRLFFDDTTGHCVGRVFEQDKFRSYDKYEVTMVGKQTFNIFIECWILESEGLEPHLLPKMTVREFANCETKNDLNKHKCFLPYHGLREPEQVRSEGWSPWLIGLVIVAAPLLAFIIAKHIFFR